MSLLTEWTLNRRGMTAEIGPGNGTDDTAAINAALANPTGAPLRVIARPGQTYRLSGPMVIGSRTTLDLTGATIILNSGLASANMIRNTAYTPTATATDGAITSGATTLTTVLAGQAAVGQTVIVAGANANTQVLTGQITAVGTGNVTLDTAAGATVSGAAVSLYTRDKDIAVIGGYWKRGTSQSPANGLGQHTVLLRHVDGVNVEGLTFATTSNGKYAVSLGDVTDYIVEDIHFEDVFSDGVHINGPARNGRISDLSGTTGDDTVSITAADWTQYNDTQGAVTGLLIENVRLVNGRQRGVQILPGTNAAIRNLHIRNIHGTTTFQPGVQLADDASYGFPYLSGGTIENVVIEGIRTARNNNTGAPVNIQAVSVNQLRIRDVFVDMPAAVDFTTPVVDFNPPAAGTYGFVHIGDIRVTSTGQNAIVWVRAAATIGALVVESVNVATSSLWQGVRVDGTVTDLSVRGLTGKGAGSFAGVSLDATAASARVDRLTISDAHVVGTTAGSLVAATQSTHTLGKVDILGCALDKVYWFADLNTTTELLIAGSSATGGGGFLHAGAASVVTLRADAASAAGATPVSVDAGGVVRQRTPAAGQACRVYANFNSQSIPDNNTTGVWVATVDFNDDTGMFTTGSNAITALAAGLYQVSWSLKLTGGTTGERSSVVRVNGVTKREAAGYSTGNALALSGSAPLRLAVNDVVTLNGYVTGGPVTVVDSNPWESSLALTRIGT